MIAVDTNLQVYAHREDSDFHEPAMQVWINSPTCEMMGEEPGYFDMLKDILTQGKIAGPMVHDARIAALCIHHGVQELWTVDRDFSRFASLKTHNPLAAA